jgi:hypothetical protein
LKPSSLSLPTAAAALLTAVAFAVTLVAQAPMPSPQTAPGGPTPPPRVRPAPTNLKVLPKTMTGDQVHDLMEKWEGSLGVHCDACHAPDPNNIGPNGRPRLNFADDSKKEKATARFMYNMTEDINKNYVSMIDTSGASVTCGTCHRGHIAPEPYVIPDDDGPRRPQSPIQAPPPPGTTSPLPH